MARFSIRTPSASDFASLLASLRAGQSWEDAFRDHWTALTGSQVSRWPHHDGRLNWLWLTDLTACERAIDVGGIYGEFAGDLTREFSSVAYVASSLVHGQIVAERFKRSPVEVILDADDRLREQEADCVVFDAHEGWRSRIPVSMSDTLVSRAFQWLRPGGWLAFTSPNLGSYSSVSEAARGRGPLFDNPGRLRTMSHQIESVGFRRIQRYFIAPEVGAPYMLLPQTPGALRWWKTTAAAEPGLLGVLTPRFPQAYFPRTMILAQR
jgi:hypothetical protein